MHGRPTQYIALRERRIEQPAQITRIENFVKFGHVVFEICEQTDMLIAVICNRLRLFSN